MNEKEIDPKNLPIVDDNTTLEELQQYCEAEDGLLIIKMEDGFITGIANHNVNANQEELTELVRLTDAFAKRIGKIASHLRYIEQRAGKIAASLTFIQDNKT